MISSMVRCMNITAWIAGEAIGTNFAKQAELFADDVSKMKFCVQVTAGLEFKCCKFCYFSHEITKVIANFESSIVCFQPVSVKFHKNCAVSFK